MRIFNLDRAEPAYDDADPEGYRSAMDRFGERIGASKIGGSLYELPEGQSICPYHYEYPEEEWLLVLSGAPTLRHPGGEEVLEPGDVVCFPAGPEGAHKVTNTGQRDLAGADDLDPQRPRRRRLSRQRQDRRLRRR